MRGRLLYQPHAGRTRWAAGSATATMPGLSNAGWRLTQPCHWWSLAPQVSPSADPTTQIVISKRLKQRPQERGFVLFDVVYEDESQASNRRGSPGGVGG